MDTMAGLSANKLHNILGFLFFFVFWQSRCFYNKQNKTRHTRVMLLIFI